MRVLVTGGTGFIGSHSVVALRKAGHDVRLLVRSAEKVRRTFAAHGLQIDDLVLGDVTDPDCVATALVGCDAVLHAAAVVALEAHRAREMLDTNLQAVKLVVGGAHERGIESILYVSSLGALLTPGGPPITEDAPVATARNAYAVSKTQGERFVRELQEAGAPIRSVYPPSVLGPDDPGLSGGNYAVRTFLRDTMVVTSGGFEILDVRDLAAVNAALLSPDAAPGRYVVAGHYFRWPELVDLMDELTGTRVRRIRISGGLLRALGHVGDVVKRIYPFEFPLTAEAMGFATQWPGAVRSRGVEALGIAFRDPLDTCRDTIRWLHAARELTDAQAGQLASFEEAGALS